MLKQIFLSLIFLFVSCFSFVSIAQAAAAGDPAFKWSAQEGVGSNEKIAEAFGGETDADVTKLIAKVINAALGLLGIIFVILLIVAGFKYMLASGDEQTKESLTQIRNSIIGLIIVISAYGIAKFVMEAIAD